MKTNIQNIERTICKYYHKAQIESYYVEDFKTIYQKIVVYGRNEDIYFYGSIVGNKHNNAELMKEIVMTSNRYEAKYMFKQLI